MKMGKKENNFRQRDQYKLKYEIENFWAQKEKKMNCPVYSENVFQEEG